MALLSKNQKIIIEKTQVEELAIAIFIEDHKFIGIFQVAPAAVSDFTIYRFEVFPAGIEEMQYGLVEVQIIRQLHPGFVEVELFFFEVFAPGAYFRQYGLLEVVIHAQLFRHGWPEGLREFIEEIHGYD